jgi:hypothetical protein
VRLPASLRRWMSLTLMRWSLEEGPDEVEEVVTGLGRYSPEGGRQLGEVLTGGRSPG